MNAIKLCTLEDLEATGGKTLIQEINNRNIDLFVVKKNDGVFCYVDSCPHTGVMLPWREDDYFDEDGELLMCATHGALFRVEDGHCVSGPCNGQSLKQLPIKIENNEVYLQLEED